MHEAPLDHPFVGAVGRAGCLCGGSTRAGHVWNPPPDPLPPERLLGPVSEFDLAALCDLEQPAAVP